MKIGVVTTDNELRQLLSREVSAGGHQPVPYGDLLQALAGGAQLVFAEWVANSDLHSLLAGLHAAAERPRSVPVIVLAPIGAAAAFNQARNAGAVDVLFAPPDPEEIRAEIEDFNCQLEDQSLGAAERFRALRSEILVGEDRAFLRCLEELRRAARADANVLLIGPTGTGKEMFALALHQLGSRAGNPYLAVNCASLPGTLLEAELFGHIKGAFTGAGTARKGRFTEVGAGTLLLDEVGDIELPFQTKLLRVIEQRVFQRLGENQNQNFNARLVCATSVNLDQAVAEGKFRHDLQGRIDQFRITLPALSERRADIPILARHFLNKHAQGRAVELSRTALEMLENYDFPMNVRQLENAIRGALIRSDPGRVILPRHLPPEIAAPKSTVSVPSGHTVRVPHGMPYKEAREYAAEMIDQIYLGQMLIKHGNNHVRVAEEAGIDRKTLGKRLKQSGDTATDGAGE